MHTCSTCGETNPAEAQFCIECGSNLRAATGATTRLPLKRCQSCGGHTTMMEARFCPFCGRSFSTAQPGAQPSTQAARPATPARPTPGPAPAQRGQQAGSPAAADYGPLLMLGGMIALAFLFRRFLFPGVLFVAGAGLLWRNMSCGRHGRGLGMMILLGGLAFLLLNGHLWPGILIVLLASWFASHLLGR